MRLFIGINLPANVKQAVFDELPEVKGNRLYQGTWVDPKLWHLTVLFLGEVDDASLPKIIDIIKTTAKQIPHFGLSVGGYIGIPDHAPYRILARSIGADKWFNVLQQRLKLAFKASGISGDGKNPHLTLVRVKLPFSLLPKFDNEAKSLTVNQIVLWQSILGGKGPVYRPLKAFKLAPEATNNKFRPNVAICILNPKNEVLLIKHREHVYNAWQFPQAGVQKNETIPDTVKRELKEELGLESCKLILVKENIYKYKWPKRLQIEGTDPEKRSYVGQEQSLAIVRVKEIRPKLSPDPREAESTEWVSASGLLEALHPLRRTVGRLAVVELEKMKVV